MYYVYILYSSSRKKRYIGYTKDLKRRLGEHNRKEVTATTYGTPWILIYYQAFCNKIDAQQEEKFLKSGKGRERLRFLLKETMNSMPP